MSHSTMNVEVQQRVINHLSLTAGPDHETVSIEVGIFADQDYDKFTDKTTCSEKREAALKLLTIETPVDGEWAEIKSQKV